MTHAGRVLVVDDDRELVQALSIRLRAEGYEVLSAFNGEDGLASAVDHRPDTIILDIRLPCMDGLTMMQEMRSHRELGFIPVVMLSASIMDRYRALELGARHFLEKPYEPTRLIAAVQSAMAHRIPARSCS